MPPSTADTELPSSPLRQVGAQPALDSDNEDEPPRKKNAVLTERDPNIKSQSQTDESLGGKKTLVLEGVKNKAFTCCIKQYGVKVKEKDPDKATAGNGQSWERRFGLFGTSIL
jgi:protection-of-telomeres protein 1